MGEGADTFASLSATVRTLLRELGVEGPTAPQQAAIPRILAGDDVLIISPTGSGKTEAALLPVFERLREVAGQFQRIGLSATVGNPKEVAALFGGESPLEVVQVAPPKQMEYRIEWPKPNDADFELARELFISPEVAASLTFMQDSIDEHRSSLVFVNSRTNAELLSSRFGMLKAPVGVHHGSLPREAREKAETAFKSGELKALVATSTLELGIDIGSVDHALQYMSPRQSTSLVQRVGRAGHTLARTSKGTIVAGSADDVLESLAGIRRAERSGLQPLKMHLGATGGLGPPIVGRVRDAGGRADRGPILAVVRRAWPYRENAPAFDKPADFLVHLKLLRGDGRELV